MSKNYTEKDLEIAGELGALKTITMHMNEKLDSYLKSNESQHDLLWSKHDKMLEKLNKTELKVNWIIGLGSGISTALTFMFAWLKAKIF